MDATICIREIERIVESGPNYVGPHGDPLAHVYGMAAFLRDMASTDEQREMIAAAISEFKWWFKQTRARSSEDVARARDNVMVAIANLRRAFASGKTPGSTRR
jgi:hypothetical protein